MRIAEQMKPKPPVVRNTIWAFAVGGLITSLGQGLLLIFQGLGLAPPAAGTATSITLIFLASLLTGLGVYDEIARYAGAGTIVPITGFANSMVSPALEAKAEGLVLGVGARLFTVAGPILVFGIVTAWIVGLIHLLLN